MLRQILIVSSCFLFVSCNVETFGSDRYEDNDSNRDSSSIECQKNKFSGCLQGQVSSALDIYVDSKSFFDVDEMISRFSELLKVEDKNGDVRKKDEYKLSWRETINNDNFAKGFRVYIKGQLADNKGIMRNGAFVFNRLPQGVYDVRAQRVLKVDLIPMVAEPIDSEEGEEADEQETKTVEAKPLKLCMVLFAEDSLEVRKGRRSGMMIFDNFDLEVKQCGDEEPSNTIIF